MLNPSTKNLKLQNVKKDIKDMIPTIITPSGSESSLNKKDSQSSFKAFQLKEEKNSVKVGQKMQIDTPYDNASFQDLGNEDQEVRRRSYYNLISKARNRSS